MMRLQLALNKTFCPNPQPLTYLQVKQHQRTKISKTMLSARLPTLSSVFHTKFTISELKSYSILTVNKLGPPVLESSARISKFYASTDSEHKFNKTKSQNWLLIGYNLGSSWLGTGSHNRYIMFIRLWEEPSGFIYPSIKFWNNPGNNWFPWSCASVLKSHTQHPE